MEDRPAIEGRGLVKRFGGVTALDAVDFRAFGGRVTALLGENGAGKSTLVACLSGAQRPDRGELLIGGATCRLASPDDARRLGVAVVHQEPQMLEAQSVAANIFLSRLSHGSPRSVGASAMNERAAQHLERLQIFDLEPSRPMRTVNGAQRQLVEIARALVHEPKVLFLDEPNASLGESESQRLFSVARQLRERGVAIVLISHRLREVYDLADHVVVMRDGRKVADQPIAALPVGQAIRMMAGQDIRSSGVAHIRPSISTPRADARPLLEVRDLSGPGFERVSFQIGRGEIVGMSGLVGSGRTEIAHGIVGAARKRSGAILIDGAPVDFKDPSDSQRQGVAFVPEGRRDAIFYGQSVDFNIRAGAWGRRRPGAARTPRGQIGGLVRSLAARLSVKASDPQVQAFTLSGGNQQKLLIARALIAKPRLLIFDEPTHGVDVGTKQEIHDLIRKFAAEGIAVWFISSEVEEVAELASRILVVHQGRIVGELPGGAAVADILSRNFGRVGEESA